MQKLKRLLLAVGDTSESEASLSVAATLAESTGAEVVLLHVTELPETPAHRDEARRAGEARLIRLKQQFPGSARVRVEQTGDPVEGILRALAEEEADLTILATQARTGLITFTEGSVAYDVVAAGKGPVLLVPMPDQD